MAILCGAVRPEAGRRCTGRNRTRLRRSHRPGRPPRTPHPIPKPGAGRRGDPAILGKHLRRTRRRPRRRVQPTPRRAPFRASSRLHPLGKLSRAQERDNRLACRAVARHHRPERLLSSARTTPCRQGTSISSASGTRRSSCPSSSVPAPTTTGCPSVAATNSRTSCLMPILRPSTTPATSCQPISPHSSPPFCSTSWTGTPGERTSSQRWVHHKGNNALRLPMTHPQSAGEGHAISVARYRGGPRARSRTDRRFGSASLSRRLVLFAPARLAGCSGTPFDARALRADRRMPNSARSSRAPRRPSRSARSVSAL